MIVARPMRLADPGALAQVICARCDQVFLSDQPTALVLGEWVHEVCPAATEFALGSERGDAATSWTCRELSAVTPPPHVLTMYQRMLELQVARAMIDAAFGQERVGAPDIEEVVATAWELLEQRMAGRVPPAEQKRLTGQLKAMAGGGSVDDRLLGYSRGRVWYPGLAKLEPREAEVVRLAMTGLWPWEIQRELKPKRDGGQPALESVYAWLSEGRRKLRELFKMPAPERAKEA